MKPRLVTALGLDILVPERAPVPDETEESLCAMTSLCTTASQGGVEDARVHTCVCVGTCACLGGGHAPCAVGACAGRVLTGPAAPVTARGGVGAEDVPSVSTLGWISVGGSPEVPAPLPRSLRCLHA